MNDNFYKRIIEESPTGYAYHRIICEDDGIPCDYEFIEVNAAFEAFTGLKGSDIIGRKITEVLPDIRKSEFDWIKFYGEIAINGEKKEFEQFSEPLKRWYRVNAYSPEKYYFITHFIDVSKENAKVIELENLQEIVKETEFKYKTVVDYAYGWETLEDETGKLKYFFPACERTSGYTVNEFLENESLFASLILEEDQERWANHRHDIEFDKGIHSEQFRIRNKNGKIVWIEHTCRPVIDKNGMFLGYRANNRDITERKEAEEEILESKNSLATLLESIPTPVFYKDINGRYLGFNQAYEDFFGKTKDELIGKSVFDISPVKLAGIYHAKDVELFERPGTQTYETQVKDARGVLHDVVFYKATMTNSRGKVTGLIGTILDITDRKQAENALKKSEERYRTVFETTGSATIIVEEDTTISLVNTEFCRLFGYSREEIEGKSFREFVSTDDIVRLEEYHYLRMETTGKVPGKYEYTAINKMGKPMDMLATVALIPGTGKSVASIIEITDRKRAEFELRERSKRLKEALSELEKQHENLKLTQSKLVQSEKMAGLGTMVAGVAHEINNPTNYVYLSSKTLEKDLSDFRKDVLDMMSDNDTEITDYFEGNFIKFQQSIKYIIDGSSRIKTIVQDLRSFSRLDEAEKKEINVAEALESTMRLVKTQYNKQIEFITDFKTKGSIECYPAQLNQVFLNIIVNSCHAILKKQEDSEDESKGNITIQLWDNGRELVIAFEDNGCGMTEEVKGKMFEPFFTTKSIGQGTGLGMSISYGVIEKHNGKIEVESQPGIGTTITVFLPCRINFVQ